MHKLNNKGYMLVEIILAVGLAMGVGYFLIDLTLKVKNANDDLLVESLVKTDQGIIYNMIMEDVYNNENAKIEDVYNKIIISKISESGKKDKYKITYGDKIVIVTEYAVVGSKSKTSNKITIPITVKQIPNENFDVVIYFA